MEAAATAPSRSVRLTEPAEFEAIFNLLGQSKTKKLKLLVAETVFLASSTDYTAVTSIVSSKKGIVSRWGARRATMKSLWELARRWCSGKDRDEPVAIARYVNASYVLNPYLLEQLVQSVTGCSIGILSHVDEAPQELDVSSVKLESSTAGKFVGGIPFAVQVYVEPEHKARYVTSFQWSDVSIVCESFTTPHQQAFPALERVINQDIRKTTGTRHKLSSSVPQEIETDSSHAHRLRQLTLAIVNYINRVHKCQLLGLVTEIVEDEDSNLWLTAVLGSCWPEQWVRRHMLQPDGSFSAEMPPSVKSSILGSPALLASTAAGKGDDVSRLPVPARNSDRAHPGVLQVIDSGSMHEGGKVQHREPWYSPSSDKAQVKIDWNNFELGEGDDTHEHSPRPPHPSGRRLTAESPRGSKLSRVSVSAGAGQRTVVQSEERAPLEADSLGGVPPLMLAQPRDTKMHVTTGMQSGNLNYFYNASKATRGVSEPNRASSSALGPVTDSPKGRHIAEKPGDGFGLHSDVAMILSPRYTAAGVWSSNTGAVPSPAVAALAASSAVMVKNGRMPPSYALSRSMEMASSDGARIGRQAMDITARLTRRVEELRQTLQEQAQEASAARIAEMNALAKQVTAEQHCQALQAELDSLRQEYDAFRIAAFNEKAQLSEDRKHAIGDMSKHRDAAESMREKYEEAKARLDKERDVAFDLAADLRAQLNAAKGELSQHQMTLDSAIRKSEEEKIFAVAELQEERAKNRSANKHIKMLDEVREALEIELKDEQARCNELENQKETMVLAMPELHLVMKTMQQNVYAHATRETIDDLVRAEKKPDDMVEKVNKILGRNTLPLRQIYLFYNNYLTNTTSSTKAMNQVEFVRFCRDCGIIESQIDKFRAMDRALQDRSPQGNSSPATAGGRGSPATVVPAPSTHGSTPSTPRTASVRAHSRRQGDGPINAQTQDVVRLLCKDLNLPDIGNLKSVPSVFLRSMNVDQLFVQCVSNTRTDAGQKRDNSERFMGFHDFVHALVRVASFRYPDLSSLAPSLLALLFQAVFPNAKRVDLNSLLAYDKMVQEGSMSPRKKGNMSPQKARRPNRGVATGGVVLPNFSPRKSFTSSSPHGGVRPADFTPRGAGNMSTLVAPAEDSSVTSQSKREPATPRLATERASDRKRSTEAPRKTPSGEQLSANDGREAEDTKRPSTSELRVRVHK